MLYYPRHGKCTKVANRLHYKNLRLNSYVNVIQYKPITFRNERSEVKIKRSLWLGVTLKVHCSNISCRLKAPYIFLLHLHK